LLRNRRDSLSPGDDRKILRLRAVLRKWWKANRRMFPWRDPETSQFERICVEVLLQRTRAETVARIYYRFFERFGDWHEIARAPTQEIEVMLRPIGLWRRRASSLKSLAEFASTLNGSFPSEHDALLRIPGIGQYVANAVLLFQHGKASPLLDTNMARVIERYVRPRRLADIRYDPWLQAAAHRLVSARDASVINWAVLDFGAIVCTPVRPRCASCPLARKCRYLHETESHKTKQKPRLRKR